MQPNTPDPHSVPPGTLPALPFAPHVPMAAAPGAQPAAQAPVPGAYGAAQAAPAMPAPVQTGSTDPIEVALKARQLVEQQVQSPYQLAESFAQLKADYLARQHHITSNAAGK